MRIAFDSAGLLSPTSRNRGIGNYMSGLLSELLPRGRHEYFFLNLFDMSYSLQDSVPSNGTKVEETALYFGKNGSLLAPANAWEAVGDIIKTFIAKNNIDLFVITSPFDGHMPDLRKEWFEGCQTMAIVYDVIPLVMPKEYLPTKEYEKWYSGKLAQLDWIDRIVTISQSAKDDLCAHTAIKPESVDVIWGAVDNRFRPLDVPDARKTRLCEKFGLVDRFAICTGGDDPRKNLAGLVHAYALLPDSIRKTVQLVIVCKLCEISAKRYSSLVKNLGLEGQVIFTNFVTDEELLDLYNLSVLVVFPSLYEGFGLPIVEGWACGKPVLTAANSSLVQIAGDAAILVNAKDEKDIARGLRHALEDCDLAALAEKGRQRLALYQWPRVADLVEQSFAKLAPPEKAARAIRKRLAFFSPLPPLKSGISDYSASLLEGLSKHYEIDVFIDDGYRPDNSVRGISRILNHGEYFKRHGDYTATVFQMGNSEFHYYMIPYIRKFGGTVVLHDYNLHGALFHKTVWLDKDYDAYEYHLRVDFPFEVVHPYVEQVKGDIKKLATHAMETNGFVVNYADRVIVHSLSAKRKLLEKNPATDVRRIWQPSIAGAPTDARRARTRKSLGLDGCGVVFGAFGIIHKTKRAIPLLQAFKRISENRPEARLVFVGQPFDPFRKMFEKAVSDLGLEKSVVLAGFVPAEKFQDYIYAIDVCVNLRHPYNGETSAAMIRNVAAGNAVVVNDIGSFSEIPDDCCIKIPPVDTMTPDEEVEAIYQAMDRCLADPEHLARIRQNAAKFGTEKLTIEKCVADYCDFLEKPASRGFTKAALSDMASLLYQTEGLDGIEGKIDRLTDTILYARE